MDLDTDLEIAGFELPPSVETHDLSHARTSLGLRRPFNSESRCQDLMHELPSDPISSEPFNFDVGQGFAGSHHDSFSAYLHDNVLNLDFDTEDLLAGDLGASDTFDGDHKFDDAAAPSLTEPQDNSNKLKSSLVSWGLEWPSAFESQEICSGVAMATDITSDTAVDSLRVSANSLIENTSSQTLRCTHCGCGSSFKRPCDLKKHMKNRHSVVQCQHRACVKMFKSEAAARRHFRTAHSGGSRLYCPFNGCKQWL